MMMLSIFTNFISISFNIIQYPSSEGDFGLVQNRDIHVNSWLVFFLVNNMLFWMFFLRSG